MRVAIDSRVLRDSLADGRRYFIYEVFSRIARDHPSHEFIFIGSQITDVPELSSGNVRFIIARTGNHNPIGLKWWLDITLPRLLKQYGADLFISANVCCSLRSSVPQVVIIHDREETEPEQISNTAWRIFYRRYLSRFMKKAVKIITFSKVTREFVLERFGVGPGKFISTNHGANEQTDKPLPGDRTLIKEKYSSSKEFFLYAGTWRNNDKLIYLLRAFSVFKKRQQTGMKLILFRSSGPSEQFDQLLKSYKYRDAVVIVDLQINEAVPIIGAAYGVIGVDRFQPFAFPFPEAMVLGIPMIATMGSATQEILADAGLYADTEDPASLAAQMMILYKDENRRNEMIKRQSALIGSFSWNKTAIDIWNAISSLPPR